MWVWGNNSWGQLGLSHQNNMSFISKIDSLYNWANIACGTNYSAAIKTDGTLWAWGNNSFGQLGQNNYVHISSPVQVGGINNYVSVYCLNQTTMAELV